MTSSKRFLLSVFLCFTHCHAVEMNGEWAELDEKLRAGDYSKLPTGTKKFDDNYYCLVIQKTNWEAAKNWCEERGGHLTTITSAEENNFILELIHKPKIQCFIGATDQLKEGEWKWITGEPFKYTNWLADNPDNHENSEHFMTILPQKQGHWDDAPPTSGSIAGFIIEWEGSKMNKKILSDPALDFPKKLLPTHQLVQRKLEELKKSGNTATYTKFIKSYGKKLVYEEKALTKQRRIKEAKAVQAVKLELIALLKNAPEDAAGKIVKAENIITSAKHVLIDNGSLRIDAEIDKEQWRKRGNTLETKKARARIFFPNIMVGKGDFTMTATIKVSRIGSAGHTIKLGETEVGIDTNEGKTSLRFGAFYSNKHFGKKIAGIVTPNQYFDWVIERKNNELMITVDGNELIRKHIHTEVLGKIYFTAGNATLTLKKLAFSGNLIKPLKTKAVIARHKNPDELYTRGMVIQTKENKRFCLNLGHSNNRRFILRTSSSKDAGMTWEKLKVLEEHIANQGALHTFSAVFAPRKRSCFALFTRGGSNQKVYFREGRNYGRNWSKSVNITPMTKKVGWDVAFTNSGITTQYGIKKDRMLVPYHAGKEKKNMYLLISDNDKDWKRIGPIIEGTAGTASVTEMLDGTIIVVAGGQSTLRTCISKDGGSTWEKPTNSDLKIPSHQGSMVAATSSDEKEILLYAGPLHVRDKQTNDLYLWSSSDQGKSWKKQDIICYGPSYVANLIATKSGEVGLFVRSYNHWELAQQRYHIIDLKKLGL